MLGQFIGRASVGVIPIKANNAFNIFLTVTNSDHILLLNSSFCMLHVQSNGNFKRVIFLHLNVLFV